jgi:hypothetical protein
MAVFVAYRKRHKKFSYVLPIGKRLPAGSPSCISAALTASGLLVATPGPATRRRSDLAIIRLGPCGDVCDRRDHVVESRAAPAARERSPAGSSLQAIELTSGRVS